MENLELETLKTKYEALRAENKALKEQLVQYSLSTYERLLDWRGIYVDHACKTCGGSGIRMYGSTSTWHGGGGGQAVTNGVCDKCWGSGNRLEPGANLKKIASERNALQADTLELVRKFKAECYCTDGQDGGIAMCDPCYAIGKFLAKNEWAKDVKNGK